MRGEVDVYTRIMVPVDLEHADRLDKALGIAADLAGHYGATACYVGVTANTPGRVAHTPEEYAKKLDAFAQSQASKHGHKVASKALISHDPAVDLDHKLLEGVDDVGADLVVVASHIPGIADAIWPSHGGRLASHAKASVLVVR